MRTKKIIKSFLFEEDNRKLFTIGEKIRLDPQENNVKIIYGENGYSTDEDLFIKTWVANPKSVYKWLGFEATAEHTKNYDKIFLTSLGFRLSDGEKEYFWNGSEWEENDEDWNTEDEVSNNINLFDASTQKIQIIINLKTIDPKYTPKLFEVCVLFESTIDFQDDLIFNSVVPFLETASVIGDFIVDLVDDTNEIDLNQNKLETPYNIVDIDSCFVFSDDPIKMNNIFLDYDSASKIIYLNQVVEKDKKIWIKFAYRPVVAVSTDQEYIEIEKIPSLNLNSISVIKDTKIPSKSFVTNKSEKKSVVIFNHQKTFEIDVTILTSSEIDRQRIIDELRILFVKNSSINFFGLDEKITTTISKEFSMQGGVEDFSNYSANFRFVLENVLFSLYDSEEKTITNLTVDGDLTIAI
jgi:hypothetical protein